MSLTSRAIFSALIVFTLAAPRLRADDDTNEYTETLIVPPAPAASGGSVESGLGGSLAEPETAYELSERDDLGYMFNGPSTSYVHVGNDGDEPWFYPLLQVGQTYYTAPGDTNLGGQIGLGGYVPLTNKTAVYGMVTMNDFSGGAQYFATTGFTKEGFAGDDFFDSVGFSFAYDQFTDTRFGNPYVGSLRYDINMPIGGLLTGIRYQHTVTGVTLQTPVPGMGFLRQALPSMEYIEAYTRGGLPLGPGYGFEAAIGYNDATLATVYRGALTKTLNETTTLRLDALYDDRGNWSTFAGVSMALGTASRPTDTFGSLTSRKRELEGYTIRAQSGTQITLDEFQARGEAAIEAAADDSENSENIDSFDIAQDFREFIDDLRGRFGDNALVDEAIANQLINKIAGALLRGGSSDSDVLDFGDGSGSNDIVGLNLDFDFEALKFQDAGIGQRPKIETLIASSLVFGSQIRTQIGDTAAKGVANVANVRCPGAFPFLVMSGGQCFCCDNAQGSGNCILAPTP